MLFNIILALSNLPLFGFLDESVFQHDLTTFYIFLTILVVSSFSYLIMNHEHLDGIGLFSRDFSRKMGKLSNFCWLVGILRLLFVLGTNKMEMFFRSNWFLFSLHPFFCFLISEGYIKVYVPIYDNVETSKKFTYVFFNCLWRVLLFVIIDEVFSWRFFGLSKHISL